jgi:hypothetical protein
MINIDLYLAQAKSFPSIFIQAFLAYPRYQCFFKRRHAIILEVLVVSEVEEGTG